MLFRSVNVVGAYLVRSRPGTALKDEVKWTEMCVIAKERQLRSSQCSPEILSSAGITGETSDASASKSRALEVWGYTYLG